mmetsp:Transcript_911/g.1246  ORF Transcript_911/g.1246 Transcript_911/m.1246 type:complete len:280 (-) Transcript_911:260-1099(-)|eukprot:CAMPEP_0185730956 /NCGR_PEP_ID=MMETSP1171-20130828/11492_1 /TAXON_ID=374046 /ORGANISM="Helicotheca tamensis, Strain CCMP826" /LENGTH=279 /DNA_ID=CAMNT_0028400107 /DNA_START=117 /DNA_END=956 /DNA_ORIENTATION=-
MPLKFEPVDRPKPQPDPSIDEEMEKAADEAKLTLYFINMVVIGAKDIRNADGFMGKSDPYCEVTVGDITDKTAVINNDLNPVWNDKMKFFVAEKPNEMTLRLMDHDDIGKNDLIAETSFEFGDMFETKGSFEGDLDLKYKGKKDGTIQIKVTCRTMKPVETEIKLSTTEKILANKEEERAATVAALDESEKLREEAVTELTEKEQEIARKTEELEEKQRSLEGKHAEKEKELEATQRELKGAKEDLSKKSDELKALKKKRAAAGTEEDKACCNDRCVVM